MHRSFAWVMIAILAIMLTPFTGVLGVPASTVHADPAAPSAVVDDEIVVITSAGVVSVDEPTTPTGPAIWTSLSEPGWEYSWTAVAAGDFNGDGDAELVAARNTTTGSFVKVFDPVVQPGRAKVNFSANLGIGYNVRLLVTGDFDGDFKDEIAVMHYVPGGAVLVWYDGGANAADGEWTRKNATNPPYGAMFQDMSAGDFNADGADDLAMVRNVGNQRLVSAWNVKTWSTIAEGSYKRPWFAVAGGNLSSDNPGDEISLTRDGGDAQTEGLILFKVVGNTFADLAASSAWRWNPDFLSLTNGDLNGDGDAEVVMLRDPTWATTSLLMVNPAGAAMNSFEQATGFGSDAFRIVRTGDTDGDGKDEIVILKGDRYRIYTDPDAGSQATEKLGSFYTTGSVSNLPFMAIANVDTGSSLGPSLSVTPTTLLFSLDYGAPSPAQSLSITNAGSGSSFPWLAQVIDGSSWLFLNGAGVPVVGTTPGQVSVSVKTDTAPGTYYGKIRINTTDPSVSNNQVDIPVTLQLRDPGFAATPSQVTLWQKNDFSPVVTREINIVRWGAPMNWTAVGVEGAAATDLAEKLATNQASLTDAGLVIDGVLAPSLTWLKFTPASGTTPATMTVSVEAGTPDGTYHGSIFLFAVGYPTVEVKVTAVVADHFHFTFLPLVSK